MRGKRFTETQIFSILEAAAGGETDEICRLHGISSNTLYRWKAKYADMIAFEARRLKDLKEENHRLQWVVAEQMLYIQALKVALLRKDKD
jgi:putative transposase